MPAELIDGIVELMDFVPKVHQPKFKVILACNTLTSIQGGPYMDHMQLAYRLGRDYPDIQFYQFFARRISIDKFRNWVAKTALDLGCYAVFFIDDDMQLPRDTFQKLFEASINWDIIAAFNYIRGYPFKIMSFRYDLSADHKHPRLVNLAESDLPNPLGDVIRVDAIGTAVCFIKTICFKNTTAPWFITGPHGTEDIYMCLKVKDYWPNVRIGMHTGIITGHLLDPEVISHETRNAHMQYVESFMAPEEIQKARLEDIRVAQLPDIKRRDLFYEDIVGAEFTQKLVSK